MTIVDVILIWGLVTALLFIGVLVAMSKYPMDGKRRKTIKAYTISWLISNMMLERAQGWEVERGIYIKWYDVQYRIDLVYEEDAEKLVQKQKEFTLYLDSLV